MTSILSAPKVAGVHALASNSSYDSDAFCKSSHLQIMSHNIKSIFFMMYPAETSPCLKKSWKDSGGMGHVPLHRGGLLVMAPDTFFNLASKLEALRSHSRGPEKVAWRAVGLAEGCFYGHCNTFSILETGM